MFGNLASDWGLYTILICLPMFLLDILHFDIQTVGRNFLSYWNEAINMFEIYTSIKKFSLLSSIFLMAFFHSSVVLDRSSTNTIHVSLFLIRFFGSSTLQPVSFNRHSTYIHEALLGGRGTVIPYPCKSGNIYPLSALKVPRLLSLKVIPKTISLIPYPQKYFASYPLSLK